MQSPKMRPVANKRFASERQFFGADDSRSRTQKGKRMSKKTRTRITIQTRQMIVARPLRVQCQQCGAEVPIITPEEIAGALQTSPREIHGLLESGELHTVGDASGENLLCANSLSAGEGEAESHGEGEER